MANLNQIELPNGESYDIQKGIYRGVVDTSNSSATSFIVDADGITSLYDGITVIVKNTKKASASGCKMNVSDTGAKPIWLSQSNSACTSHWALNQTYMFVYDATNDRWELQQGRDSDTRPINLYYYNGVYAKTALTKGKIIVGDADGYSAAAANVSFNITFPILYTEVAIAAGNANYYMWMQYYNCNLNNIWSGFTSAAQKMIYMVATINGVTATIDSTTPFTDTLPVSDDGKVYIAMGRMGVQSTGKDYFHFQSTHPMFWYKDGRVIPYAPYPIIEEVSATDPVGVISTVSSVTGEVICSPTHKTSGVTASTYQSVTVDEYGHVTAGSNPTTLSEYGITDAKITSSKIQLGSKSVASKAADSGGTTISLVTTGEKYTWNSKTDTSVKGYAESSYRTGEVNLTPENLGFVSGSRKANTALEGTSYPYGVRYYVDSTAANRPYASFGQQNDGSWWHIWTEGYSGAVCTNFAALVNAQKPQLWCINHDTSSWGQWHNLFGTYRWGNGTDNTIDYTDTSQSYMVANDITTHLECYKSGDVCQIHMVMATFSSQKTINANTVLWTIKNNLYYPAQSVWFYVQWGGTRRLKISTSGAITIDETVTIPANSYLMGNVMYLVKN